MTGGAREAALETDACRGIAVSARGQSQMAEKAGATSTDATEPRERSGPMWQSLQQCSCELCWWYSAFNAEHWPKMTRQSSTSTLAARLFATYSPRGIMS